MESVDKDQWLKLIAQLESSNGQNTNHPMVEHGVNKGTHAIGTYALMPATVDELIKRDPAQAPLMAMNPDQKQAYLMAHPEVQKQLAGKMYDKLNESTGGDPAKMAYKYNHGMYLPDDRLGQDVLNNDDYTNKFTRLSQKVSGEPITTASITPEGKEYLKKSGQKLPTIDVASLDSIINDPANPFNKEDDEETEKDSRYSYL